MRFIICASLFSIFTKTELLISSQRWKKGKNKITALKRWGEENEGWWQLFFQTLTQELRGQEQTLQNVPGETSRHLIPPKCFLYLILTTLCYGQLYNKNPISSSRVTHAWLTNSSDVNRQSLKYRVAQKVSSAVTSSVERSASCLSWVSMIPHLSTRINHTLQMCNVSDKQHKNPHFQQAICWIWILHKNEQKY